MWILPENGFNLKLMDKKTNTAIKKYSGVNFKILPRNISVLNININTNAGSDKTENKTFITSQKFLEKQQQFISKCSIHGEKTYEIKYPAFYQPWTCTQTIKVLTNPQISYTYNNVEYIQNNPCTINNKYVTVKNFKFYFKKAKSNLTFDNFSTILFDFYKVDIIIDTNDTSITLWSKQPEDLSNIDDDKFQKTDSDVKITDR